MVPAGGLLGVSPLREEVVRAPSVAGAAGEPVPVVLPAGALPLADDERGASCADDAVLVEAFPLDGAGAGAADAPSPSGAAVSAWSSAASSACWSAPSGWLSAGA